MKRVINSPLLSNPAAKPIGFGICLLNISVSNKFSSSTSKKFFGDNF